MYVQHEYLLSSACHKFLNGTLHKTLFRTTRISIIIIFKSFVKIETCVAVRRNYLFNIFCARAHFANCHVRISFPPLIMLLFEVTSQRPQLFLFSVTFRSQLFFLHFISWLETFFLVILMHRNKYQFWIALTLIFIFYVFHSRT